MRYFFGLVWPGLASSFRLSFWQPVLICMNLYLAFSVEWNECTLNACENHSVDAVLRVKYISRKYISRQLKQFGTNRNDHGPNANHRRSERKKNPHRRGKSSPFGKIIKMRSLAICAPTQNEYAFSPSTWN